MKTAFYECDITPPLGCYIPGHYKDIRAVDVADKIFAKATVIENEGSIAALVCVDTVTLPAEMHDIVTKRVFEYTGIEPDRVCICCNHSHSGAPIESTPDIGCFADEAYKDIFFRLAADAIILAYKRLDDAEVSFANTEVSGFACHVRLFVTPWTAAHQAPPSMGFSRQEYWSGVPLPSPLGLYERWLILR